jgi:hypothetical protein
MERGQSGKTAARLTVRLQSKNDDEGATVHKSGRFRAYLKRKGFLIMTEPWNKKNNNYLA